MRKPIVFYQEDPRWGKMVYSSCGNKSQTMRSSGSAPTLAADIVATLKDKNADPWTLAQLALACGCRTRSTGTCWPFFAKVAEHYRFSKFVETSDWERMIECLDAGGYVICQMMRGYWTPVPNYILAWTYDSLYVYGIMGNRTRRERQRIEQFKAESRRYFCFYPDGHGEAADQ